MATLRRISYLEGLRPTKKRYLCVKGSVIFDDVQDGPYRVQPIGGGKAFYLKDENELETFRAREDVNLIVLNIGAKEN